jgi:hypothetical protein
MQLKAVNKKSRALEHVRLKIKCDLPSSSPVVCGLQFTVPHICVEVMSVDPLF